MKILIVDDNSEKIKEIMAVIHEFEIIDYENAMDIQKASQLLKSTQFDLLILDINLPNRMGEEPLKGNGTQFLKNLQGNRTLIKPLYTIGLTAYDDEVNISSTDFSNHFSELIHYDASSEVWKQNLRGKIKNIILNNKDVLTRKRDYLYDYAIITALKTPELDAVLEVFKDTKQLQIEGDPTLYYEVVSGELSKKIILATDDTMGMVASAQLSEKVMQTFRPRCLLMGGIAAGIQGKSNLGDILVAASSWNYDSGKYLGDGQLNEFLPDFQPINISVEVNRAAKINIDTQLFEIKKKFAPDYVTTDLNVIVGPVASGSAVISDSSIIRRAQSSTRKLIGIEMEIYGMYYAAMHTSAPRPIFLASKSVCDFADETKNDNYQKYASQTSAAYLKYLIDNSVLQ